MVGSAIGLALLAYYLSTNIVMAVAAAMAFAVLVWRRLDLALLAVPATAPLYLFPKQLGGLQVSLVESVLLVCLAVWIVRRMATKEWRLDRDNWLPPTVLIAAAIVSLPFSEQRQEALREFRVIVLEPAVYYVLVTSTYRSATDVRRGLVTMVVTGGVVAVYAIAHYVLTGAGTIAGGARRALAVYHSPNALALFLGRIVPIAAAFALFVHRSAAIPAILMLAAVSLTFSRGAVLGLLAAVGFLAAVVNWKAALVGMAGVLAVAVLSLPFLPQERLGEVNPIAQRLYVWQAAIVMAIDHPITGVGLDNFLYQYPRYMLPEAALEPDVSHAHNIFLDFWTRLGILGLAAMAWLQYHFWRTGAQLLTRFSPGPERTFVLAVMASMLDFLVHGLLDNSYFLIDLAYIFWLSYALLTVLKRITTPAVQPHATA